jgi:phosphinothricin acetyltransferase
MLLRHAEQADLPAIQGIYAHHVLHGTGTFEDVPPPVEEMTRRWQAAQARGWHWVVATDATGVLGYAAYAQFRDKNGYRYTAEDSIYVRDDVRGQGVGKALVAQVLAEAAQAGFRQMIAVIGDSENVGSIGVHATLGFRHCGVLRSVGAKFGRWLDAVYMQRPLGEGDAGDPG